jgi:DNA-directed RNA polymerase specialized sigma24 family protein
LPERETHVLKQVLRMKTEGPGPRPEPLLDEWLAEPDSARAGDQLESLLCSHAAPLVRRIVGFKLANSSDSGARLPQADVEDVCQNALCQLMARLERMKAGEGAAAVRDFTAYVAVTAYNACNAYFRARRPAWLSLSMKIRYVATHSPKFALWDGPDGSDVCSLASQKGREPLSDPGLLNRACDALRRRVDPSRLPVADLISDLLQAAGGPLLFDSLVDAAADLCGIQDDRVQPASEPHSTTPAVDDQLVHRNYIRLVWKEIAALPLEHRRALLLNLNDSAGGDIRLFDALGIASVRQIAAVLEMEPLEFARLWNDLPLDDARLADFLGISRQDVANRRSTARKRLARRLQEAQS